MFFLRLDTFIRAASFGFRQQSAIPATKRAPTDTRAKEELPAVLENRDTEPMDSKSPESNHAKAPILTPGNPVRPRASSAPAQGAPRARTIYA